MTDQELTEIVETLSGKRGPNAAKNRAVLVSDLEQLLASKSAMKSREAGGVYPTKAEFNALRADVQQLNAILADIAEKLRQ